MKKAITFFVFYILTLICTKAQIGNICKQIYIATFSCSKCPGEITGLGLEYHIPDEIQAALSKTNNCIIVERGQIANMQEYKNIEKELININSLTPRQKKDLGDLISAKRVLTGSLEKDPNGSLLLTIHILNFETSENERTFITSFKYNQYGSFQDREPIITKLVEKEIFRIPEYRPAVKPNPVSIEYTADEALPELGYMRVENGEVKSDQVGFNPRSGGPENVSWNVSVPQSGKYRLGIYVSNPYSESLIVNMIKDWVPNDDATFIFFSQPLLVRPWGYTWIYVPSMITLLANEKTKISFHAPRGYKELKRLPYFKKIKLTLSDD